MNTYQNYGAQPPQQLINGVDYGISNDILLREIQALNCGIGNVVTSMQATDGQMLQQMQTVIQKVDSVTRKKRRSIVSRQIATLNDGSIAIVSRYNDGSSDFKILIWNVSGPWNVYSVKIKEGRMENYFLIYFSSGMCILGEKNRKGETRLYEKMVEAGVRFNADITRALIKEVLFEAFANQIFDTQNCLEISSLAGWSNGKFQTAETFSFLKVKEFQDFPVLHKHLSQVQSEQMFWKEYFLEMRKMRYWEDRTFVMTFLFAGMLHTLLERENCNLQNALNFVLLEKFPRKKICAWLQVFNRYNLHPVSVDVSEKKWNKILAESKDENFIMDVVMPEGTKKYDLEKVRQRQRKTMAIALEGQMISGGEGFKSSLVMISTDVCLQKSVYDIFVDEEFYQKIPEVQSINVETSIESLIHTFIEYCETHISDILRAIRSQRSGTKTEGLQAVWSIMESFWKDEGIDLYQEAGIPQKPDFSMLIDAQKQGADDICQFFKKAVRKAASSYSFLKKEEAIPLGEEIRYDKKFLWFPLSVQDEILKKAGLYRFRGAILLQLKREGILKTDVEGFTRKLQIQNQRKERYQFSRDFFNEAGKLDIVSLGKEDERNV